jgi:hypothetical protein
MLKTITSFNTKLFINSFYNSNSHSNKIFINLFQNKMSTNGNNLIISKELIEKGKKASAYQAIDENIDKVNKINLKLFKIKIDSIF